ncbi:tetratricopeptide repeat protein [Vicingaceae bacterium]|nr:tetratricopeptide repeat protein [Vicingaceae bacterium]
MMKNLFYLILTAALLACQPKDETKNNEDATLTEVDKTKAETSAMQEDSRLSRLNEKIRADINNKDLYLARADYFLEKQNPKEAMQDINRAFRIDTVYLPTLLKQADFLTKSGKLELSLNVIDKANQLHRNSSTVQVAYSQLYLVARNNEKSLSYADLAIKYDMYNAEAYYLKGFNFLEIGDTSKAISSYQTAVEQDPEYFEAFLELGLIFSQKNDPIALEYINNALEIQSTERRALYSKGMYEQEHEMFNEAMLTYTAAIKSNPDFREAYYNLGYIHLFYLKLYRQSQQYFTDAIDVDPRYKEAYYNRGYAFELLGDINNAAKDYRKALEIDPSYDYAAKGLSRLNN